VAHQYAAGAGLADGEAIGIYDLGGGTFDATVVARAGDGFVILGRPEGLERLGGVDVDLAILGAVQRAVPELADLTATEDPQWAAVASRLRADCVEAKHALSSDTVATVPVYLPTGFREVRLNRSEVEGLITPLIDETLNAFGRALTSAAMAPEGLRAIVLAGGSARIPLVAQLLQARFRCQLAVDLHPKLAVATGAALVAAESAGLAARVSRPTSGTAPTPPFAGRLAGLGRETAHRTGSAGAASATTDVPSGSVEEARAAMTPDAPSATPEQSDGSPQPVGTPASRAGATADTAAATLRSTATPSESGAAPGPRDVPTTPAEFAPANRQATVTPAPAATPAPMSVAVESPASYDASRFTTTAPSPAPSDRPDQPSARPATPPTPVSWDAWAAKRPLTTTVGHKQAAAATGTGAGGVGSDDDAGARPGWYVRWLRPAAATGAIARVGGALVPAVLFGLVAATGVLMAHGPLRGTQYFVAAEQGSDLGIATAIVGFPAVTLATCVLGLSFGLRAALQERVGPLLGMVAVAVGTVVIFLVDPTGDRWFFLPHTVEPASAAGIGFAAGHVAAAIVYETLRRRNWLGALAASQTVGAVVLTVAVRRLATDEPVFVRVSRSFLFGGSFQPDSVGASPSLAMAVGAALCTLPLSLTIVRLVRRRQEDGPGEAVVERFLAGWQRVAPAALAAAVLVILAASGLEAGEGAHVNPVAAVGPGVTSAVWALGLSFGLVVAIRERAGWRTALLTVAAGMVVLAVLDSGAAHRVDVPGTDLDFPDAALFPAAFAAGQLANLAAYRVLQDRGRLLASVLAGGLGVVVSLDVLSALLLHHLPLDLSDSSQRQQLVAGLVMVALTLPVVGATRAASIDPVTPQA
jgi:hypothetical protein